ncbi:DNA-deoxyinosine glycosylase [Olsenella profusa]|uniref:DNA-deoxyinosine glycosylase n=1 Tax=Olsenella profusa TaxID=138595 RepID=A0ABS2F3L5_9ACTN|nr:DNA-deoxyinosine glycosylase [Olsenella profusa]MBM6775129.1 DNA-deoxyinosine glycosylase [Olsenella profusa]
MAEYQHITHGFEPVFDERSRVLVLGSFPSVLSRENRFYYGNPRNRFWRVMAAALGEPVPADGDIPAKRALLLRHGVALWDVIESCDVRGSSDASIRNVVPADVARITSVSPIRAVLCNGGTAARLYHRWLEPVTGMDAVTLPSTSPANAAWSAERLAERWSAALAPYVR